MAKDEEEFVLPDAGMVSDSDSDADMTFLDSVAESKQIQKLEKERKRRIQNAGEEFEQNKRRFVLISIPDLGREAQK